MDKELIERLAREAGFGNVLSGIDGRDELVHFAQLVAAECAKVADEYLQTALKAGRFLGEDVAHGCPAYIRAKFGVTKQPLVLHGCRIDNSDTPGVGVILHKGFAVDGPEVKP